jgi:hypothetical protein
MKMREEVEREKSCARAHRRERSEAQAAEGRPKASDGLTNSRINLEKGQLGW